MGLFKIVFLFPVFLFCAFSSIEKGQILFLLHNQKVNDALAKYQKIRKEKGQDIELLEEIAKILLLQGSKSKDAETERLALYGVGITNQKFALEVLEQGLNSNDLESQLIALHFLALFDDDETVRVFYKALSSDFLMTRLEALYILAEKKDPLAESHIDALMQRLPVQMKYLFPSLFSLNDSIPMVKTLLFDEDNDVRVSAILEVIHHQREDLLELIRKRLSFGTIAEKEASAFVLGNAEDTSSIDLLRDIKNSSFETLKAASFLALSKLGDKEGKEELIKMAKEGSLYAISALGNLRGTEETLVLFLSNRNRAIRTNAALSLLKLRDGRCIKELTELILEEKNFLLPHFSIGRTLQCWEAGSCANIDILSLKESLLSKALLLEEKDFILLSRNLFLKPQRAVIPHLIFLLESLNSESSVLLLKEQSQRAGIPLIRDYCHLSLYKLHEKGSENYIVNWIKSKKYEELIRLRHVLPHRSRIDDSYTLNPEEASRLFLDMLSALLDFHSESAIDAILDAMNNGNPKNRYPLAGLLLRALE